MRDLILLERKRVFTQVRNDMVWLFIDPTEQSHTAEIAKGLEEFAVLSMALDKRHTPDLTNHAVNNEALMFADNLVKKGYATWKPGWNMDEVRKSIHNWQIAVNENRITNILEEEQRKKTIL